MNILSLHLGHDGAITIIAGDEVIIHHQLDRFNKFKHEHTPVYGLFEKIKELKLKFDKVIITSMRPTEFPIEHYLNKFFKIKPDKIIKIAQGEHHIFHALCAKFFFQLEKDFIIYVADGDGAIQNLRHESKYLNGVRITENESIYDENLNSLYKKYQSPKEVNFGNSHMKVHPSISLGKGYQTLVYELGLEEFEEGKAMALSSHGKLNPDTFKNLIVTDAWNLWPQDGPHKLDPMNKYNRLMLNPYVNHLQEKSESLDFVHSFQKAFEYLFLYTLKKVNLKNKKIILTGGCAQNVLSNSNVAKELPNEILADPFNGDFGISLGAALNHTNEKIKPLKHICSGFSPDQDLSIFSDYKIKNYTPVAYVAKILMKEPIAIFSGKSEQGQRGLGFRSLVANPLTYEGKKKVNSIKRREWYRPFACTILKEKAKEYFNMGRIKESPFMMFVFKSKDSRLKNVCSVDGYSRIQTLDKSFHPEYYNLIVEFSKLSGAPVVLNTSLNLPGDVLCETYQDLLTIFKNSELKYCWLPELKKLIYKP